jgi:hypothetical protein
LAISVSDPQPGIQSTFLRLHTIAMSFRNTGVTTKFVGLGSKLISKEILDNKDYEKLKDRVSNTLELIKKIRS